MGLNRQSLAQSSCCSKLPVNSLTGCLSIKCIFYFNEAAQGLKWRQSMGCDRQGDGHDSTFHYVCATCINNLRQLLDWQNVLMPNWILLN